MSAVTIRNLPDAVHRAIKIRAAEHSRSAEAEMRAIPEAAVQSEGRVRLRDAITDIFHRSGLTDAEVDAIASMRDTRPAEPMRFECSCLAQMLSQKRCGRGRIGRFRRG
jgi:antitoxin FitA